MPIYEDLSPYVYLPSEVPMKNVGWLGVNSFPLGRMPERARDELLRIASEGAENMMRGTQDCPLCGLETPVRVPTSYNERGWVSIGNGEYHVVDSSGTVFAAPTLLWHYINDHQYLPPQEFIDALLLSAEARSARGEGELREAGSGS